MKTAACLRLLVISVLTLLAVTFLGSSTATYAAVTGTVSGTVTRDTGAPLAGATVTLTNTAGAGSSSPVLTTNTASNGFFSFAGVQPGTYTLDVAAQDFEPLSSPVVVQQDFSSTVDFTLSPKEVGAVTRIIPNAVRRTDPSSVYVVTAKMEQEVKSQPNDLYQFPGLVFGQPGITVDPGQYPHIRGGDQNEVGFGVDGVTLIEPVENEFSTNIVSVGLKSLDLYTGGADASYGGASSGFINEITHNGKDFAVNGKDSGGIFEYTNGPGHGWNYSGTNDQFGGVAGKIDYYFATVMFRNDFPGNTQIQELPSSFDGLAKVNYYIDPRDTLTGFYSQGYENYYTYQPYNPANTYHYFQNSNSSVNENTFQQDHQSQHYYFNYLTYQHDLTSGSFLSARIYQNAEPVEDHAENTSALWLRTDAVQTGYQLDYSNSDAPTDSFKAGVLYLPQYTNFREIDGLGQSALVPLSATYTNYLDFGSKVHPVQTAAYASNLLKLDNNEINLTTGLRYGNDDFNLNSTGKSFSDHYVDPRIGLTFSPTHQTVFKTSYSVDSQFPGTDFIERLPPELLGYNPTVFTAGQTPAQILAEEQAQIALTEGRYASFNQLQTQHTNDFDLGVEQSFNALGGVYDLSVTGFGRYSYNLPEYARVSYRPLGGVRSYDSTGHGHSSGVENILTKRQINKYDWSGFVSYTNEVDKATDSYLDTGYLPYFYNAYALDAGVTTNSAFASGDNTEYPTTWNQRHTVAIVINKRASNIVEFSAFLDAGSGYPFKETLPDGFGIDSQHGAFLNGGDNVFGEVPVTLSGDGSPLAAINPTPGQTGWHYKISLNTNIYLSQSTNLFIDVDNIFDKQTILVRSTATFSGIPYYQAPTPQYPQGSLYYGPQEIISPTFVSFGVRTKF